MPELKVIYNGQENKLVFEGTPVLSELLIQNGYSSPRPCGGRGKCGKCAVRVSGNISEPNEAEIKAGTRLSCQVILLGDCQVILSETKKMQQIELSGNKELLASGPMPGRLGAAADIGTTTLAMRLIELSSGKILGEVGRVNPQTAVAADVMGRIGAALQGKGELLRNQVLRALEEMLNELCVSADESVSDVESMVITGNTTMLYFLTGRNPECLSHAPFDADCLYGDIYPVLGRKTLLPFCMNAFVGADITCAVLAAEQTRQSRLTLLCDIGTNGEIALWKDGVLYVTSTAAGPAFEGAGISCGCGSVLGAIDRVEILDKHLQIHTIGDVPACGICGSGLIDAVAAFLETEMIDETGAIEEDKLPISGDVTLAAKDIRAVQLAKSAIAAGISTLLEVAGVSPEQIETLYIAGGFGSHLRVDSAVKIGLIPEVMKDRTVVLGNAALTGACRLLLNCDDVKESSEIAAASIHVNLGGNPRFNELYVENMLFPENESPYNNPFCNS